MKTKEQLLSEATGIETIQSGDSIMCGSNEVFKAMDEYAKEVAILYAEFRTEYKREEQSRFLKAKKEGTGAKWLADSDEKIYAQFIEKQSQQP